MSEESVVRVEPHEKVLLIHVEKGILDEVSSRELADEILSAVADRPTVPVVLDMSQLRFVPSAALGSLVQAAKSLKLDGRRMALIGIEFRVMKVIRVTQLHTFLEIHHTLEKAIEAFEKDS